jgi:hypothetical protein
MVGTNLRSSNVPGANMYMAQTCQAPTCTRRQHKGTNLTSFSQKPPQNCHFWLNKPKWIFLFFLFFFCTFNFRILPWTTRKTCAKKFTKFDCTDCEIITFEVEKKVLFPCARQGQHGLTAFGETFLNYVNLMLSTISMHIMLCTCIPNFTWRGWLEHTQMHLALKKGTT